MEGGTPGRSATPRLKGLELVTSFRFFFASAVVLLHFGRPWLAALGAPPEAVALVVAPFRLPFFFVVSGFLLGYTLRPVSKGGRSWGGFLRHRLSRLYPMYLLALLATVAFDLVLARLEGIGGPGRASYVIHAAMVQTWFGNAEILRVNPPAWYIATLMQLSLLAPLFLRLPPRRLLAAAAVAVVLPNVVLSALPPGEVGGPVAHWEGPLPLMFLGTFGAGFALGRLRKEGSRRVPGLGLASVAALLVAIPGLGMVDVPAPLGVLVSPVILYTAIMTCLVYAASFAQAAVPRGLLALGDLSLGMLLLHWPWHRTLQGAASVLGLGPVPFPIYFVSVVALSWLTLHAIERPATRWLDRLWADHRGRAPTASRAALTPDALQESAPPPTPGPNRNPRAPSAEERPTQSDGVSILRTLSK